jgi:NAD(P)-dependent dehydrogenase (short-subunit alcohol dehydrogenase family)
MEISLAGRRALVTGSTRSRSNIGFTIAKRFAEAGGSVVVTGRTDGRVGDAVAQLHRECPDVDVAGVAADLTDTAAVEQLIESAGQVDVLVHNAGTPEVKPFFELTDDDWTRHIQLHLVAAVRLSRHYGMGMRSRDWGRILASDHASAITGSALRVDGGIVRSIV